MSKKNRHIKSRDKRKKTRKYKGKLRTHLKNKRDLNRKNRHIKKIELSRQYIEVFSQTEPSDSEISLLAKGLKFIPAPAEKNIKRNLLQSFDKLARKMRLKFLFYGNENVINNHPFTMKSGYTPNFANTAIENYIFATKIELGRIHLHKFKDNLTKSERMALQSLKQNKEIVIKKADKNSSTVILDKKNYIEQALSQLNDGIHYEQIAISHCTEIYNLIESKVKILHEQSHIDDISLRYLLDTKVEKIQVGRLYLLPKIHKIDLNIRNEIRSNKELLQRVQIPGRPIISLCNSPIERIGQFIDYFLQPIVRQLWTFTQDTTFFINKIERIEAPDNVMLATFDISSMYTNLSHEEIIQAVYRACNSVQRKRFITNKILDIKLYRKPTDNYQYLHRSSSHPSSVFKGFITGEIIRFIRSSNNVEDIEEQVQLFREKLQKRGYVANEIDPIITTTMKRTRESTLRYITRNKGKSPPLCFITKFNPRVKQLGKTLRKHWHLISNDGTANQLFQKPPIIAYQKHKNLKEYLTSSKLK
ncbi:Hypothetical predicted protein [Mytilus galloprovincialis]|uniref:Helix-turn-helix domain-containing protein n=1 Tax=Mytilus galloprovincialis TaxID=29158 RepID=A0A8B6FLR7_MYTGA|nr:Hypothetical predicted protein [Mytilus galloprovincialis]